MKTESLAATSAAKTGIAAAVAAGKKNQDPNQAVTAVTVAASTKRGTAVATQTEKKENPNNRISVTKVASTAIIAGCLAVCCS